jgi:hypothetical protein
MCAQVPTFNQDYDFYKEQVFKLRAEKAELIEAVTMVRDRSPIGSTPHQIAMTTLAKYETK